MALSKKGIMLDFLVTVIIALIVFIPACTYASKLFFRVSEQAKENFGEFSNEIITFSKDPQLAAKSTSILILDDQSGIIVFKENKKEMAYSFTETSRTNQYFLAYPQEQCNSVLPCACLCRSFDQDKAKRIGKHDAYYDYDFSCQAINCIPLPDVTISQSWSKFRFSDNKPAITGVYYNNIAQSRRTTVSLVREGNEVRIQG